MATATNTPLTADICLEFDDLLESLPTTPHLGGPGPFVINLCVSTTPIDKPLKPLALPQDPHLYLIQRTEDGRTRYRLRLGPFVDEDRANALLGTVRDIYPSALTATAGDDDMRAITSMQAKAAATQPPMQTISAPPARTAPPAQAEPEVPARAAPAPQALSLSPANTVPPAQTISAPLARTVPAAQTVPVAPARAAPAPQALSLSPANTVPPAQTISAPTARTVPAAQTVPVAPARTASAPQALSLSPAPAMPPHPPAERRSEPVANLDSTQTARLLTSLELQDETKLPWYVVQLALAEQAFDPDTVPNLDIFGVYRLYCVAGIDQGRIMHALRLGFFSEEVAATAVASYLSAYYDKPTVKRVSTAERERFADQPVQARKDVGATGKHAKIEITNELVLRKSLVSPR
jgi:hypothetical protein